MTAKSKWANTRRDFLRQLGVGMGMLPLLTESRVSASTPAPTRLLIITKGNGMAGSDFWPTWASERPANGSLMSASLPFCSAPLAPFRDRLLFIRGLTIRNWLKSEGNTTGDNFDAHHNWGSVLTGALPSDRLLTVGGCRLNDAPAGCRMLAGGPSIDTFIGGALRDKDPTLQYASLHLGVAGSRGGHGMDTISWTGRDAPNTMENSPSRAYSSIFAGLDLSKSADAQGRAREKLRILDYVGRDIERFSRRLGSEDRQATQAHLQAVSERQQQLSRLLSSTLTCEPMAAPNTGNRNEANTPTYARLMLDMLIDSFKCGIARVGVLTLFDTNAYDVYFTWLKSINSNFDASTNPALKVSEFPELHYHSITHGANNEPATGMYRDANKWLVEQMAYALDRLSREREGNLTMLDNTLVLWADTLSSGGGHSVTNMPWVLAGNANGYFSTGRELKVPNDTATNGLFVALANAMGTPPPNQTFGDAKFGSGELSGVRG